MKERPILFSAPMVRALLDGTKTQTRRIVKGQMSEWATFTDEEYATGQEFFMVCGERESSGLRPTLAAVTCPYGQPGGRLWVRETFMDLAGTGVEHRDSQGLRQRYAFAADAPPGSYGDEARKDFGLKWKPSIHMPRAASRILLEVVNVRVERLQDIGAEEIEAEGVITSDADIMKHGCRARVIDFMRLWEGINGAGSWDANPWVWVVEFKRVQP